MENSNIGPLTGVKVLDLSGLLPGPYCSQLLADMGARIVKVERPTTGDPARQQDPLVFEWANRGKESVVIDLKSESGLKFFRRLVPHFDVVLEGFRPGVASRLGIGFPELVAINAHLIYCSISGYGQKGPYSHLPGHDLNYQATAGWRQLGGDAAAPISEVPIGDLASGALAAVAVCASLREGGPQYIDLSITDCLVSWGATREAQSDAEEATVDPGYGIYECQDGSIALGAIEDHFWRRLCQALDLHDTDHELPHQTLSLRRKHGHHLRRVISEIMHREPVSFWMTLFEKCDVPASPLNDRLTVANDPHLQHRSIFSQEAGSLPGSPLPWAAPGRSTVPILGQHSDSIQKEFT